MSSAASWSSIDRHGLNIALEQARKSAAEGGIPIGSVLLTRDEAAPDGYRVLGKGHNQRIQKSSATLHGEISALENAGRLKPEVYRTTTIVEGILGAEIIAELTPSFACSPCSMCTGAILLYKIGRVVIGENKTFLGGEEMLKKEGVEVVVADSTECEKLMGQFISENPKEWNEDIGEL